MAKKDKLPWHVRISELLRLLGTGQIDVETFWRQMKAYELTDEHIERYCRGER